MRHASSFRNSPSISRWNSKTNGVFPTASRARFREIESSRFVTVFIRNGANDDGKQLLMLSSVRLDLKANEESFIFGIFFFFFNERSFFFPPLFFFFSFTRNVDGLLSLSFSLATKRKRCAQLASSFQQSSPRLIFPRINLSRWREKRIVVITG